MDTEAYTQPQFSEDYNVKNFFLYYKDLIDMNKLRDDKAGYVKLIRSMESQLRGVDFRRDCLFVRRGNACKEAFLCALSTFPKLTSYRYLSLGDMMDFWWGHLSEDRDSDQDSILTFRDLRETVLCVYVSSTMVKMGPVGNALVTTATERAGRPGKGKHYTWMYFDGSMGELSSIKDFQPEYEYYRGVNGIIDLNGKSMMPSPKRGQPPRTQSSDNLADVY